MMTPLPEERLLLYLTVLEHAVSGALMRSNNASLSLVYYVSKILLDAESRYTPLKKLALALVSLAKKLRHYFQEHQIVVLIDQPLKALFRKFDLSRCIAKWVVELEEYDVVFEPRTAIKGQIIADFIAEFHPRQSSE